MPFPATDDSEVDRLKSGGVEALARCFDAHRARLKQTIKARIDKRLIGRLDESDIIQETFVTANSRLDAFLNSPNMPVFLWLRLLTQQVMAEQHRNFLKVQKRNPEMEMPTGAGVLDRLTNHLAASMMSPHSAIRRAELVNRVRELLDGISDNDREILTMIHLEGMKLREVSQTLNLPSETTRKRHYRAMQRLRDIVAELDSSLS